MTPQWSKKSYEEYMDLNTFDGSVLISPCLDCKKRLTCRVSTDQPFTGICAAHDPLDETCDLPDKDLPYGEKLDGEGNGICGYNIPYKYW